MEDLEQEMLEAASSMSRKLAGWRGPAAAAGATAAGLCALDVVQRNRQVAWIIVWAL
jgi:hypothetical protein